MDAQDRQSHTKGNAREDQRRTATIAPLVGLKVARSGTPPSATPFGLTGVFPAPGLLRRGEALSMSLKHCACWCTAILPGLRGLVPGVTICLARMNSQGGVSTSAPSTIPVIEGPHGFQWSSARLVRGRYNASRIDFDSSHFNSCVVGLVRGVCGVPGQRHPAIASAATPLWGAFRRKRR
jgi:hypothetical protein